MAATVGEPKPGEKGGLRWPRILCLITASGVQHVPALAETSAGERQRVFRSPRKANGQGGPMTRLALPAVLLNLQKEAHMQVTIAIGTLILEDGERCWLGDWPLERMVELANQLTPGLVLEFRTEKVRRGV